MTANPKATIHKCGKVIRISETDSLVDGWFFDCRNEVAPFGLNDEGEPLVGGYTLDELREIAARPAEFEMPVENAVEPPKQPQMGWFRKSLITVAWLFGLKKIAMWLYKPYATQGRNCIMPNDTLML